jgi:hypothetical protein
MRAIEFITEVTIDNVKGAGATPYNQEIDYFGLRVKMKPSIFLKLALPLGQPHSAELEKYIADGGAIGSPFLEIKIPQEWDDSDFSKFAQVAGHEGRNRITAIKKLEGDEPIEVHLIPRGGLRARDLTAEFVEKLQEGMYAERSTHLVSGPLFVSGSLDEMALSTYKTMGDFTKPGPFQGTDKKLVPHPKNIEKATQFFEKTPYDFRLFFSNIPGTGKYSEHGPMTPEEIKKVFGPQAESILQDSGDAITVVFVGNKGDRKVMLTPWMMAHRFGHAIQAGNRGNRGWSAWGEAEKHFFTTINSTLGEYYGKVDRGPSSGYLGKPKSEQMNNNLTPEYNALFNAIGTQRSSRSGEIRRPYEFLYELFAQYLGTGKVTLNPLPSNLGYGRKAWGNPSNFMNIKPEFRDESERARASEMLAGDMQMMFDDVLNSSVGKVFVM